MGTKIDKKRFAFESLIARRVHTKRSPTHTAASTGVGSINEAYSLFLEFEFWKFCKGVPNVFASIFLRCF